MTSGLIEHIEKYLGKIENGYRLKDETSDLQVITVSNQPVAGVSTYSTLGMSWTRLPMSGERLVRQELLFAAYESYSAPKISSFLLTFSQHVLATGRALPRGDVVGPYKPLISGVQTDSIYCTLPVMFEPRLATFSDSQPPTVFVWLVPIARSEARFVRLNGWNRFEDLLEKKSPDFWNLDRVSLCTDDIGADI